MNENLLTLVIALLLGLLLGWQFGARRVEARLSGVTAEAAGLRVALANEQQAQHRRESLLVDADLHAREVLGSEAAQLLDRVQAQLDALNMGRASSDAVLREQARAMTESTRLLQTEASALVTALRAPQTRGRWGEMQLERVVEAAGMLEHVDYSTQVSASTGLGAVQRPDLLVRLAGGKQVVVDAKAPVSGYLAAIEARDEAGRAAAMKSHARHLRTHIDQLSAKQYWQQFSPTPEFVVCFLPADTFLDAALRDDPSLLEHAFASNIVLATPSTLVALLRTIAYSWRQEVLAADIGAVHDLGRELHTRLSTMGGHVDKLGRSLGAAVAAYNDTVGSLERRVLSTARRFTELGVVAPDSAQQVPAPRLLEVVARPLTAPEFDAAGDDAELGDMPGEPVRARAVERRTAPAFAGKTRESISQLSW